MLNQEGDRVHFGLIASDTTDKELTHEFFNPERERFLEYDLTKIVFNLANPRKPVVGLITGLPLEGGAINPMMGMRQPQLQPWLIVDLVREFYDIRTVAQDVKAIPPGIDVLLIVQPDGLTKEAAYAIDQYTLGGGRVLAFLDPNTFHGRSQGMPGMPPMPGGGLNPEMGTLLKSWGVAFDPSKVVGDIERATPVQFGPQRRRARYVAWMRFNKADLNEKEPMASACSSSISSPPALWTRNRVPPRSSCRSCRRRPRPWRSTPACSWRPIPKPSSTSTRRVASA